MKSNIGHLELAAGVAAVTKVLLQLEHRRLVPTLHVQRANPNLALDGSPFVLQREAAPWTVPDGAPRRAGISSFGAGGANAHVVLEEAPASTDQPAAAGPFLLPLSGATETARVERAAALAQFLRNRGDAANLSDVAYTLQIGREAMTFRLALVAGDWREAAQALDDWAAGRAVAGLHVGEAASRPGAMETLRPDGGTDRERLEELGRQWAGGAAVDWGSLHNDQRRRIPLPTYSFAKRRCWVRLTESRPANMAPAAGQPTTSFSIDDALVSDHRVEGQTVLAGALILDAAHRALGRPSALHDIAWARPAIATASGLTLEVERESGSDSFVVRSEGPAGAVEHARGRIGGGAAPAALDIPGIEARCERSLEPATIYPALAAAGVAYGPAYQALAGIRLGEGEALATLRLPDVVEPERALPVILDGALQTCFALLSTDADGRGLRPARIGEVTFLDTLPPEVLVWARRTGDGPDGLAADFTIATMDGRTLVEIDGFVARRAAASTEPPLRLLRTAWIDAARRPAAAASAGRRVALIHGGSALARELARGLEVIEIDRSLDYGRLASGTDEILYLGAVEAEIGEALLPLFRLARAMPTDGASGPALTVATFGAKEVIGTETLDPAGAAATAFAKALAHERPGLRLRLVDLDPEAPPILATLDRSLAEVAEPPDAEIAIRDGVALVKRLEPVELPTVEAGAKLPSEGVWLIVGGTGGLGAALAGAIAAAGPARIALLGRRPQNDAIAAQLAALAKRRVRAIYLAVDLGDAESVAGAVAEVRRQLGPVTHAVHSALAMDDARIESLSEERLLAVLAPKVQGLENLVMALAEEPLDSLLLFSSSNAHTANPGQSAYAAASAFEDTLGLALARDLPVRIVDWGFWGEVGRVATPEYRAALGRLGVLPITTQEGLDVIQRLLAGPAPHLMALRLADRLLEPMGILTDRAGRWQRGENAPALAHLVERVGAIEAPAGPADAGAGFEAINRYAAQGVALALRRMGLRLDGGGAATGVAPKHARLLAALLDMLERHALLVRKQGNGRAAPTLSPGISAEAQVAMRRELLAASADAAPYLDLVDLCTGKLSDVLAGKVDGAEVLFSGGSASRVEAIYKGNAIVDHYQQLVAASVAAAVEQWPGRTVRILEVGAGTGATTGFVLKALEPFRDWVEYLFTDISRAFLDAATERFTDWPRLRCRRFDVERPGAEQGLEDGAFDVVVASNVLHATARLDVTLANLKALMRRGGILVLNEATVPQDVNTVTFGLTPGWWRFEDAHLRLPHAPVLDVTGWRRRLAFMGFGDAQAFGLPRGLQHVIVAQSDGYVRETLRRPAAAAPVRSQGEVGAKAAVRSGEIEERLRQCVARALHLEPDEVDPGASFSDFGAEFDHQRRSRAADQRDLRHRAQDDGALQLRYGPGARALHRARARCRPRGGGGNPRRGRGGRARGLGQGAHAAAQGHHPAPPCAPGDEPRGGVPRPRGGLREAERTRPVDERA